MDSHTHKKLHKYLSKKQHKTDHGIRAIYTDGYAGIKNIAFRTLRLCI